MTMDELALLQAVRLKGRVRPGDLAATLGEDEADVDASVKDLGDAGLLLEGKTVRLSPAGRERLSTLLDGERRTIDGEAFARAYDEFRSLNGEFKALVAKWQLRDGEPNDHSDAEYDAGVLSRLDGIHHAVLPILASASAHLRRLDAYSAKLSGALEKIHAGDTTWFTRPLVDSYHTVWFELHEELIGAAGLTREGEAAAGHAE
jgi:DNA-binding MarR family transcriptional regulator